MSKKLSKKKVEELIQPILEIELCGGCAKQKTQPEFKYNKHEEDKKLIYVQLKCDKCDSTKILRLEK